MLSNRQFLPIVFSLFAVTASASNVKNFEILTAADLSPAGGTFVVQGVPGGMYFGTFSVDLDTLPTTVTATAPLVAASITTTAAQTAFGDFPTTTYTGGFIEDFGTVRVQNLEIEEYFIQFIAGTETFGLEFLNIPGTFVGGQIISAADAIEVPTLITRFDMTGDAIAVDPALATPEPSAFPIAALILAAAFGFTWRRRNSVP